MKDGSQNDTEEEHEDFFSMRAKKQEEEPLENTTPVEVGEDGLTSTTDEFDSLWEKNDTREIESDIVAETIKEEEEEEVENIDMEPDVSTDGAAITPANTSSVAVSSSEGAAVTPASTSSLVSRRSGDRDRPWATPKYRRDRETETTSQKMSGPADYIDPTASTDLSTKLASAPSHDEDDDDIARIAADLTVLPNEQTKQQKPQNQTQSIEKTPTSPVQKKDDPSGLAPTTGEYSPKPKRRFDFVDEDTFSVDSGDSIASGAIILNHQLPGADPTLRIQVHNDLIAWESKRRSDLAQHLEYNREQWQAASEILRDGIAEAQYAERLILGISKASKLFADSLRAVYDDKLLDDRGNAVKNSFLQNRLAKQRSKFEYSIENVPEDSAQAKQSMLLDSIVEAQLEVANAFVENTTHMEQEILPEIAELKAEITSDSRRLEAIGDNIIQELKRSEIEVKNIWGKLSHISPGLIFCSRQYSNSFAILL